MINVKTVLGVIVTIIVGIPLSFIFLAGGLFQTAGSSVDFTHIVLEMGKAKDPLQFGTASFIVSEPMYSSACIQTRLNAPGTDPACWTATTSFDGTVTTLVYGEKTLITDYLEVTWQTNALVENGALADFDRNDLLDVYFDPDAAITFTASAPVYTRFGDDVEITLDIENKMPEIDVLIEIKERASLFNVKDTFAGESEFFQTETTLVKGNNKKLITVPTDGLGAHEYAVSIIIPIQYSGGEYLEGTSSKTAETTVVSSALYDGQFKTEEPTGQFIITEEKAIAIEVVAEESFFAKIINSNVFWIILGIIALIVIGYVIKEVKENG